MLVVFIPEWCVLIPATLYRRIGLWAHNIKIIFLQLFLLQLQYRTQVSYFLGNVVLQSVTKSREFVKPGKHWLLYTFLDSSSLSFLFSWIWRSCKRKRRWRGWLKQQVRNKLLQSLLNVLAHLVFNAIAISYRGMNGVVVATHIHWNSGSAISLFIP